MFHTYYILLSNPENLFLWFNTDTDCAFLCVCVVPSHYTASLRDYLTCGPMPADPPHHFKAVTSDLWQWEHCSVILLLSALLCFPHTLSLP